MPIEAADLAQITAVFAEALRQGVAQATEAAISSNTQRSGGSANTVQKPPPFILSEYKPTDGATVESYFERFELAAKLSKITPEEFHKYARVHMGTHLNGALKFLIHPKDPDSCTYDEIKKTLIKHFDLKKNKYAESIKFRQIIQQKDESIAMFTLRLKQAAINCEYGEFLDRMLTEQLIFGIHSRVICDEIISKNPNTFNEAYEIAHSLEATDKIASKMKSLTQEFVLEPTNKLGYAPAQRKKKNYGNSQRWQQPIVKEEHRSKIQTLCQGCGAKHKRSQCTFKEATCFACGKTGHIAKMCKSKVQQMCEDEQNNDDESGDDSTEINCIRNKKQSKGIINAILNGCKVKMEVDTGAPCGIIGKAIFKSINIKGRLKKTDRQFTSYTGHKIPCLGRAPVSVQVGNKIKKLNVYIMDGEFDSLFGREWISQFTNEINWTELFSTSNQVKAIKVSMPSIDTKQTQILDKVLANYEDVFSETAGLLTGAPAKINLKPGATPIFLKAREIPLALRNTYAAEIDAKIASGLFKRVDGSEWASPTHVVAKKNGRIRITGNYKPTLNPRMIIDEHPIPKAEMLFNKMKKARLFCHLDIRDAYSHLPVDEDFAHALTLNTPTHGLIRPCRAVYGAANIPAIWQRRMESVLQDLPNVCSFFDDILIHAENFENLITSLEKTLDRLRNHGLKLNREKCVFAAPAVEFLGHKIDAKGIHKSDTHIQAIKNAKKPTSVEEMQLFLGKACYYNAFISNLSTRSKPLREMIAKEKFEWTPEEERAYEDIKNALISKEVLMPYDPKYPLLLATDASKVGLGAVLSHRLENGLERPIAYASRTLTGTEQKYPQMDKEALAIVWAVQKFFLYVYARHWTLITDHKPLAQILHPHKSLPNLCISRMANYADFLGNFDFDVIFKPTKENANADFCSRVITTEAILHIDDKQNNDWQRDEFDEFIVKQIEQLPIRAYKIARETRNDEHLGTIVKQLEMGKNLQKLGHKAPEMNYKLMEGCLLFEHRVVIPVSLRQKILKDLHSGHLGIVKMKGLSRSFVYWPGLDADIEKMAKSCENCAKNAHNPPKCSDHYWEYPKGPWERIHIDYAGPIAGKMILVVSDAYSKWLEVKTTNTITAAATISMLDELFAAYGVPVTIVSDNGTNFRSEEFKTFTCKVGIKYHKFTAPYHPATNGQAERSVQTIKNALKAMNTTRDNIQSNINEFLRQYRRAPHSTTGQSPSQLFLGRHLRTRLDLIFPQEVSTTVTEKQLIKINSNVRSFQPGQNIWFLTNNPRMDKWVCGNIVRKLGDLHYEVEYKQKIHKRHIDQLREYVAKHMQDEGKINGNKEEVRYYRRHYYPSEEQASCSENLMISPRQNEGHDNVTISTRAATQNHNTTEPVRAPIPSGIPILRRSSRTRRPRSRYSP